MVDKKITFRGRAWVLVDRRGNLIEDIDTDQIYHNAHLHLTDISQMGQYTLGNLEGWQDFSRKAERGDFVVAGRNFGAGSSRQQAVDCFNSIGIRAIIAPSFGAIYFRNAVNSGFPVLRSSRLEEIVAEGRLVTGDELEVDLMGNKAENLSRNFSFEFEPLSSVQLDIFRAGNLFKYGKIIARRKKL
ncbi:MAG: 3-isopropylmalate dehydratase [Candidatus Aminicenantales bacterium]